MNNQVLDKESKNRAILYCRSAKGDDSELQDQKGTLDNYAKVNGLVVVRTYMESGTMGTLTYNNLRLQAKYHEFDELLIMELAVLGNSSIEITKEAGFLVEKGVRVISIKDGELNIETLPKVFRKYFTLNNQGVLSLVAYIENHLVDLIFIFNYNIHIYKVKLMIRCYVY